MTSLYLCMSEVAGIHKMHSYTHTRLFKFKIKGTTNLSSLVRETKHVLTSSIKSKGGWGGGGGDGIVVVCGVVVGGLVYVHREYTQEVSPKQRNMGFQLRQNFSNVKWFTMQRLVIIQCGFA